ncbi:unnamed protein product [Staurois parvus]|uniref:Uncharacterized protein n=1 Tax=Staurois parvus TaxID=386267 RepID=A0ABN9BZS9_9NEOB|nr:unnamed protein product [Staurois parvus]
MSVRLSRHTTEYSQRLWSADTVQEMTRDCGHSTGDDQRLQTQYRRWTRDCGHSTGDDQRLRTQYRR